MSLVFNRSNKSWKNNLSLLIMKITLLKVIPYHRQAYTTNSCRKICLVILILKKMTYLPLNNKTRILLIRMKNTIKIKKKSLLNSCPVDQDLVKNHNRLKIKRIKNCLNFLPNNKIFMMNMKRKKSKISTITLKIKKLNKRKHC